MTSHTLDAVRRDENDVSTAVEALPHIRDYLDRHHAQVVTLTVDDAHPDETLVVLRAAVELLARILAHTAAGQGVSVVPAHAELMAEDDFRRRAAADELTALTQDMGL
jgi:hypothetical protein